MTPKEQQLKKRFQCVLDENPGTKFLRMTPIPDHNLMITKYQVATGTIRVMAWRLAIDNAYYVWEPVAETCQVFDTYQRRESNWYFDLLYETWGQGIKVLDPGVKKGTWRNGE